VTSHETTTPPGTSKPGDSDGGEEDNNRIENEVLEFGTANFGELASPYISPYVYKRGFLDTTYGIRKVGDNFMIGDSPVGVDVNSNVYIKKQEIRGTKGLWELLNRKRVDKKQISTDDLQQYKNFGTNTRPFRRVRPRR
jgi:hypothetical protein